MKELGSSPRAAVAPRPRQKREAIEVHEEELGQVQAQALFKLRCGCGRAWFELELPRLVRCPACEKLNLVSL
jgi:hypothetical protein